MQDSHFQGKKVLQHVVEKRAKGVMTETHGKELPGHLAAGTDAARETALWLMLLSLLLSPFPLSFFQQALFLALFAFGLLIGKMGRSASLSWANLERLHRIVEQERYEIEHHRSQEREELKVLYAAKGFTGTLLEQVVDVLMADGDRLLRVMLEEELGLTLEVYEHPLKQALGAGIGVLIASICCLAAFILFPHFYSLPLVALLVMGIAAAFSAKLEENRLVPATIWYVALGALSYGAVYFMLNFVLSS